MRVKYKGKPCHDLTPERVYTILGVQLNLRQSTSGEAWEPIPISFILVDDSRDLPLWYPASLFEVSDPRLSRHWVWEQTELDMIILSHPVFAQTGLLWDLYNTDFWSEEYARNIQLCHTVLWELMNEYGILPHEKRLFDISEADEWLSWIRECLSKAESTEQKECLARLFNLYLPPEPYDKMTREEQTKFALVDYIFGLFINDQLWQELARLREIMAYLEGREPFLGYYLRIPRLAYGVEIRTLP